MTPDAFQRTEKMIQGINDHYKEELNFINEAIVRINAKNRKMNCIIGLLMLSLMLTLAVMVHSSYRLVAPAIILVVAILTGVITGVLLTLSLLNIRRSSDMCAVI